MADQPEMQPPTSLAEYRLQKLEKDSETFYGVRDDVRDMRSELDGVIESLEEVKTDMGRVRTALYSLAASVVIASLAFVFGVAQLVGGP